MILKEAETKHPFIWPKNKDGEDIVQRVGQGAPGNAKAKKIQNIYIDAATAMYWKMQEDHGLLHMTIDGLKESNENYELENKALTEQVKEYREALKEIHDNKMLLGSVNYIKTLLNKYPQPKR